MPKIEAPAPVRSAAPVDSISAAISHLKEKQRLLEESSQKTSTAEAFKEQARQEAKAIAQPLPELAEVDSEGENNQYIEQEIEGYD